MMKGERAGQGPLNDVWAGYKIIRQLSDSQGGADGDWGPLTVEGVRRACHRFALELNEEEIECMFASSSADDGGGGHPWNSVDLARYARIVGRAPWF